MFNIEDIHKYYLGNKEEFAPLTFGYTCYFDKKGHLKLFDKNGQLISMITEGHIYTDIKLTNNACCSSYYDARNEHFNSVEAQIAFIIDKITETIEYTQCKCEETLNSIYAYYLNNR